MKLQFAQTDITAALTAYIVAQGISLEGKSVDIKFTMRKGNAGVAADVSIEAMTRMPDLKETVEASRPVLAVVQSTQAAAPVETPEADEPAAADPVPEAVDEPVAATGTNDAAPIAKTTSLFN